ncbi:hypothetical protein MKW98_005461 [Papaver atlanticum]|uniref:Uncharacterized protein n=1 Tax=Papaver atlanticum TaxID=357466 RepID=A0AAD4T897_9MAGN|nr:hypothetical protein MKW98_005461 [Papaver atlanticum]
MDIVVKYYESEMRKKDDEIDYWKRKSFVLQSQCGIQEDAYKAKVDALCAQLQEKKLDYYLVQSKLKDLTNGISTTQDDELKYKTMCDKLNQHIEELKTRCKESELKDLTNGISTSQNDELKYKMMCDKLNEQIEELKMRCKEWVSEVELKLKCEVDLERQLKDCKAQYSEMYEELKRYKTTCDQLNEQNEEFKRRCKELVMQAESRLEKQVDLETQLNEQKEEFERRSKELATQAELRLEKPLNEQKEEFERRSKELAAQVESRLEQQVDLEKQLNEQKEEFERRSKELAAQAESRLEKQVVLEKQLNDYKAKYGEMYVRFKEGRERVAALENDLKEYMRICSELNEQVESSEEKVRATSSEAGKCIDKLTKEIVHLGDEKRKVEDESEDLKTKFRELESKTALYLKELGDYEVKCHGLSVELKEKELEFVEYQSKLKNLVLTTNALVDELEGYKMAVNGLKEQIMGLAEDRKVFSEREKKAEERIAHLQEVIKSLVEEKCNQLTRESKLYSSSQIDRDKHVSGPINTTKQSEPSVNLKGVEGNAASPIKMEIANPEIEEREIALFKLDNFKPAGVSQMCSNEDDKEIKPKHTCDTGSTQRLNVSTSKRERLPETVTTDSDERKMKKLKELTVSPTPNITPMNICAGDIAPSSKCQNAEEYIAKLQQKLVSRKMCAEKKSQADGTSKVENTLPDCLEMGGRSSQDKAGSLTTENDGDKVTEEANSDSGGDSDTEDAEDVDYLKLYM